jgi:hypothetical protein
MLRWLAAALIAAAILAAGALEIAWGQAASPGVEGLSPDERRRLFRDGWSEEPGK